MSRGSAPAGRTTVFAPPPSAGTFRGFHWNPAPHGEAKTVRCVAGSVFDVIVDMRPESPTLHRWFGVDTLRAFLEQAVRDWSRS